MSFDIKRRTELHICSRLSTLVAGGYKILPMTGFGVNDDERTLEPPFIVVSINSAEKTHDQYSIYSCEGAVQIVTHADEVGSEEHAALVRAFTDGLNRAGTAELGGFTFSGLSITGADAADEESNQAHVDKLAFKCLVHESVG